MKKRSLSNNVMILSMRYYMTNGECVKNTNNHSIKTQISTTKLDIII